MCETCVLIQIIKYGVVSIDEMCDDLLRWNNLYVSGRMHKPTATLFDATKGRVPIASQANLASALRVAFLLLPSSFNERDLYMKMASISYMGDFRMRVPGGENRNKIRNIVENQMPWFRMMCVDLVSRFRFVDVKADSHTHDGFHMTQEVSPLMRARLAANLPEQLRKRIIEHYLQHPKQHPIFEHYRDADPDRLVPGRRELRDMTAIDEVHLEQVISTDPDGSIVPRITQFWTAVVRQPDFSEVLFRQISAIVDGPARLQSLKGLYTAGIWRSLQYLWSKFTKVRRPMCSHSIARDRKSRAVLGSRAVGSKWLVDVGPAMLSC